MREVMRQTFDELWILDLGGDNLGARKTPNVFAIQIPVAIAMGVRGKVSSPGTPAKVWYAKIEGSTRDEKLTKIAAIDDLSKIDWKACPDDWHAPFLPKGKGAYFEWPKVTDLFPYHTAGAVFYRAWPIGETREVLTARWENLKGTALAGRGKLFKESRDRKLRYVVNNPDLPGYGEPAINAVKGSSKDPLCVPYGFRSFDQQYAFYDFRLGDFIRPSLNRVRGEKQIYLVCPDSLVCGLGPIIGASSNIPDQHFFRGSFGGKDVIPLYRDAAGTEPNVTAGLLAALGKEHGSAPSAEDLAAYVYALLGGQSYTKRFWNELETPGPRVPMTKDGATFADAVKLGRKLIWLHTYAARFQGPNQGDEVPNGKATTDRTRIGIRFSRVPVTQEVKSRS